MAKKSYVVIGLGQFGTAVCEQLIEMARTLSRLIQAKKRLKKSLLNCPPLLSLTQPKKAS
jgi:Trk K+ transport system NAD-binding subunit